MQVGSVLCRLHLMMQPILNSPSTHSFLLVFYNHCCCPILLQGLETPITQVVVIVVCQRYLRCKN